jgi:hypothetical protein
MGSTRSLRELLDPAVLPEYEREEAADEVSPEAFDRVAFALEALDRLRPRGVRIAVCEGSKRVRVESGRRWGGGPEARWAVVSVPRTASRRAIALAVAGLARAPGAPYVLDLLLRE